MPYKSPKDRMKVSKRRHEVETTGKPIYKSYNEVPGNLFSFTQCEKMKRPVIENEEAAAWVLNRKWNGYLPLYKRENDK